MNNNGDSSGGLFCTSVGILFCISLVDCVLVELLLITSSSLPFKLFVLRVAELQFATGSLSFTAVEASPPDEEDSLPLPSIICNTQHTIS